MRKMIWLTIVSVLALVFIVPAVLASALSMIPINLQPGYDYNLRRSIYSIRDFTQRFVSKTDNLTAIGISIRNPNLKNKSDVIFSLYDSSGNQVRSITINGQNLEDGSFTKFVFSPIPDSFGKEYAFKLSSPGAGPEETIEVFIIDSDEPSGIIEYSYMEETHAGGTPVVLYKSPESKREVIKEVYSNWISRFLHLGSRKTK